MRKLLRKIFGLRPLSSKWVTPSFKYILPFFKGKRVADLGCGPGRYLRFFSKDSIGVDSDKRAIKKCKDRGLTVFKRNLNKRLDFPDAEFEGVFLSHVLEHVESPINLLRESWRILKKNGTLIIAVPTYPSVARIFGDEYFDDHPGHLYTFSPKGIKVLLAKSGFSVKSYFVEPILLERFHLLFLLDFLQKIPIHFATILANGFWIVAKKNDVIQK